MKKETQYAAIVDAYSSGNLLAPEFKSRGLECIHVQSTVNVPPPAGSSFHTEDFAANIVHEGDAEKTLMDCRRFPLRCLIAGSETGVELADMLSERLGLTSNGSTFSASRRDKFKMVTQVQKSGLRTIPSFKTSDFDDALRWINEVAGWPVVIKPLRSAGTDSVATCTSPEEFLMHFTATLGKLDQFNSVINELLIQKRMEGREYIIDMVSSNGTHHVTNVWLIVKGVHNEGDFVCEYNQLLDYDEGKRKRLLDYTEKVLAALGIKHGPSHTELFLTTEGPLLIETASRLHGAGFPIYSRECVGYSQVDLTVDAYVDLTAFQNKSRTPYRLARNLLIVELISSVEGTLKAVCLEAIERLSSFRSMKIYVEPNMTITRTVDVFTSPGHVVLMHEDPETIWRDYNHIRYLERKGFLYQI